MKQRLLWVFFALLSVVTGAVFLYSAWTKIDPIQPFEYTMVEYLRFPWLLAAIAARFFIGLEAALGGLLVLHLYGNRKWVLRVALWLLLAFSIYLAGLWVTAGNNVNCGCFGDHIFMSPAASLVKNAVLAAALGALLRWHRGIGGKANKYLTPALFAAGTLLPFILFYIPPSKPSWTQKDRYHLDLAKVYEVPVPPVTDLRHGKHIIAFLSPSCQHCRIAAKKMRLMKEQDTTLPFFMVIGGKATLTDFWKATGAQNIPWSRLAAEPFLDYTGGRFPLIVWVNDGWVEATATYNTLDAADIKQWLTKPSAE